MTESGRNYRATRDPGGAAATQPRASRRPRWLCVAYAFPPINRSGTHRTLGFVQHLDRWGWDATVLTAEPRDDPVDPALEARVPASTTVIRAAWTPLTQSVKRWCFWRRGGVVDGSNRPVRGRAGSRRAGSHSLRVAAPSVGVDAPVLNNPDDAPEKSFRDWASRLLLTPDSRIGWVIPAVRAARREIRRCRPAVIYSTSPFASAHLIALVLSRWCGRPWVADFRDPWRGNPFRTLRYATLDTWDTWLEQQVCRAATRIICNTPALQNDLAARIPWAAAKCVTIPNGYDRETIEAARPLRLAGEDTFVVIYCGNFYGPRSPLPLFRGLRRALACGPAAQRLRLVLVGEASYDGCSLQLLAEQCGVGSHVDVLGVRPHSEVLSLLRGADAAIVLGLSGPASELQVPNKLYEYLAAGKPILALAPANSAIADVLSTAKADAILCHPQDERGVARALRRLASERKGFVDQPWAGVEHFDRRRSADQFARLLIQTAGLRRRGPQRAWPVPARATSAGPWRRPVRGEVVASPG